MDTSREECLKSQSDFFDRYNFDTIELVRKNRTPGQIHNEYVKVRRICQLLRLRQGCRVLDIGCGTGFATTEFDGFRNTGVETVSIDFSSVEIRKAVEYSKTIRRESTTFLVADACNLPFKDDAFDAAFCIGLLHHIQNHQSCISEMKRIAAKVCVIEPNLMNPIQFTWRSTADAKSKYETKAFIPMKLKQAFEDAGFARVAKFQINFLPYNLSIFPARSMSYFEPLLERIPLLNLLSGSVVVLAEK